VERLLPTIERFRLFLKATSDPARLSEVSRHDADRFLALRTSLGTAARVPTILNRRNALRGAGIITIRLHGTDEDTKRRFNRTENVRPIPPGDPDFARIYPRRSDADSINRHLDDTLWLRRAHSVGHYRQTLNIITYAVGINALASQLHRQQAPPAAA